jgi:hypothetical protein
MRRRLVLLSLVATSLALPASASASTKSRSLTLTASGQEATLVPKCPRGKRATGGGFLAPPPVGGPAAIFYESRKSGQRSWRISVAKDDPGALPVTAFVYCSADAPKTKTKSTSIAISSGATFFTADASCGSAGKAQAGGFLGPPQSSGSYTQVVDSFRSSKNTWRSRGFLGGGAPTLTSYVYCADSGSPRARSGSTSTSANGSPATALSAPCKGGTHVGAGGFSESSAGFGAFFYDPYESFRVGKAWRASAFHSGPASTTLNSIAYCV